MFDVYGDAVMIVISYMSVAKRRRKNLREKRNVFKWRLNMCSDGDDVTCAGSPFQTRAAETGKARSPTVQRRVGGTMSASDDDERSRCLDSKSALFLIFSFPSPHVKVAPLKSS